MGQSTTPQVSVERFKREDGFLQPPHGITMELPGLPHGQSAIRSVCYVCTDSSHSVALSFRALEFRGRLLDPTTQFVLNLLLSAKVARRHHKSSRMLAPKNGVAHAPNESVGQKWFREKMKLRTVPWRFPEKP